VVEGGRRQRDDRGGNRLGIAQDIGGPDPHDPVPVFVQISVARGVTDGPRFNAMYGTVDFDDQARF
jgi:hypothetical protein